jgi:DNA topoisomerase-1
MICEREDEIRAFITEEYWSIEAELLKDKSAFKGKLTEYLGDKVKQFSFTNADMADAVKSTLIAEFGSQLPVYNIEKKQRNRYPSPPFTTSTLQQEASRKLGFSAQRTMKTAQTLYEGISLGSETIGLITYMRTDSVSLAAEALVEIRGLINQRYGKEYLPETPRFYKTKSKNAQEAHEARKTNICDAPS